MPTLFWRFALLFLAQINIPIRHFFFFSQKQCIRVKHKHRRTTIVHDNFDTTFSVGKFRVFYGAELGVFFLPSSVRIKSVAKLQSFCVRCFPDLRQPRRHIKRPLAAALAGAERFRATPF